MKNKKDEIRNKRILAFLLDFYVTGVVWALIYAVFSLLSIPKDTWYIGLISVLIFLCLMIFRDLFCGGRSIGKRALGLFIVNDAGEPADARQLVLRNITIPAVYIDFYLLCVRKSERTLGDRLSHTSIC